MVVVVVVVVFGKMGREENRGGRKYVELKSVQLKGQWSTGMTFESGLCLRTGSKGVTNAETRPPHAVPDSRRSIACNLRRPSSDCFQTANGDTIWSGRCYITGKNPIGFAPQARRRVASPGVGQDTAQ